MGHSVYAHSSIAQPLSNSNLYIRQKTDSHNSKLYIRETKSEETLSTRMILFGKSNFNKLHLYHVRCLCWTTA